MHYWQLNICAYTIYYIYTSDKKTFKNKRCRDDYAKRERNKIGMNIQIYTKIST